MKKAVSKILIIAGTRPEVIKVAPLVLLGRSTYSKHVDVKFCFTGQHRTMGEETMKLFGFSPDLTLDIMKPNQTLDQISKAVFERLPDVLSDFQPDVVLVQGDTTTAAMAGMCSFHAKIPVGHVEAGLRSYDFEAPFPEELNRRTLSCVATYNFCPTKRARENLLEESINPKRIFLTGNTVVDAIRIVVDSENLDSHTAVDARIRQPYILITAHRRESFGLQFQNICRAIEKCARKFPSHQFVYPVHLNPNVKKPVEEILGKIPNVLLLPPVSYNASLTLLKHCSLVLTDSGGIQEEAPSFRKYCIVMRDVTERTESIKLGISELVGTEIKSIVSAVTRLIERPTSVKVRQNPYGDGHAAERILDILKNGLADKRP